MKTIATVYLCTGMAAAQCSAEWRSSNIVVFSGRCAYTNFSTNARPVRSFRGDFRFATDSRQWRLDYRDGNQVPTESSTTYDGQALYTLYVNLPSVGKPGAASDLGDVTATDTPSLFSPARMPWFAAWACGLIPAPAAKALPPWALWTHESVYETRIATIPPAARAGQKFEFLFHTRPWQALRDDPRTSNWIDSYDFSRRDYMEGAFEVTASTNLNGVTVPWHAEVRRVFPPERGGRVRAALVLNTTNVEWFGGTIEKPRFLQRTAVNDWRAMKATPSGPRLPMTRPLTYYASTEWLDANSLEWQMLVHSNALGEARLIGSPPVCRPDQAGAATDRPDPKALIKENVGAGPGK